jgi:hypothetical protein
MSNYYTYVLSSLPALLLSSAAPISYERFLQLCGDMVDEQLVRDLAMLKDSRAVISYEGPDTTICAWRDYDVRLRNELVRVRARARKLEPQKFLRAGVAEDIILGHVATRAHRDPSLVASERVLDEARWRKLEDLEAGHYFDAATLIIYGLKLGILLRWDDIRRADSAGLIAKAGAPAGGGG